MFFDTHAHYEDERFAADRDIIIDSVHKNGVEYILNVSSCMASAADSAALAQKYDFIYSAVGVHPHNVDEMNENTIRTLAGMALMHKVVAIGEIGLDYHYDHSPKELQKHWFARQIGLAREIGLPVVIHDREAHEDVMKIIKTERAKDVGGVFHCYSGSPEMAKQLLDDNFYISIGGPVTFKNSKRLIDVVKMIPDDRLLIETDCPYLAPEPYRGKRNDSGLLKYIAGKIAEIKGVAPEDIARITTGNAKTLFKEAGL